MIYHSTKHAMAAAASPEQRLDTPRAKLEHWCPECRVHACDLGHEQVYRRPEAQAEADPERERYSIAARGCLRLVLAGVRGEDLDRARTTAKSEGVSTRSRHAAKLTAERLEALLEAVDMSGRDAGLVFGWATLSDGMTAYDHRARAEDLPDC